MIVEYKGRKLSHTEWEKETGVSGSAIIHRMNRGWSAEKTLTTPLLASQNRNEEAKISKTEAERWLNDLPLERVPESLKKYLHHNTKRYGTALREYHRPHFDKWYEEVYAKGLH